jgi:vancomycin resistance protein YoaR
MLVFSVIAAAFCSPSRNAAKQPRIRYQLDTKPMPKTLSEFSTHVETSEKSRNANIRLAASHINGLVLKPKETFSFNIIVGERTEVLGYKNAPTLTSFGKIEGIGGGICQLAGTIYNAVLLADLEIIERHPHGLRVRYIAAGRDATVSPVDDLKFTNTHSGPIRLVVYLKGPRLICQIESTTPLGKQVDINVEISRLPDGNMLARTYRQISQKGKEVQREAISEDVYPIPHN